MSSDTFEMSPDEAVNSSLATLIYNYNNHFSVFQEPIVQKIYEEKQIINTTIRSDDDLSILTENSLITALQAHAIKLYEATKKFCTIQKRPPEKEKDKTLYPIRKFVSEYRHTHAHMEAKFLKPTWDVGYNKDKKPFKFIIDIPISKISNGTIYNPLSETTKNFSIEDLPGEELKTTKSFIHDIILLSFHFRHIFTLTTPSDLEKFLSKYQSKIA